jgi:glycosyltransferase involved in cell wall biosynthesis
MPGIGIDTVRYDPARVSDADVAAIRAELALDGRPLMLMIAAYDPGKRHDHVLHAFAGLSRDTDAVLAFAGDGPLRVQTERLAATLGMSDRVRFLGNRRDVEVLVRASSAVLLASDREGLPRSIMEALSLEVPVIGSRVRGVRDLLAEGTGLLVEPGDVEGLERAMRRLLGDPAEAREMGLRGRKMMRRDYDVQHIIRLHDDLYRHLKDRGRARP